MPQSAPSLAGKLFAGRYRIDSRLGWGRLGQVFVAAHDGLRERLALRVVPRRLEGVEVRTFQAHLRAASHLEDGSIARILDFGICAEGWPYVVSELVEGTNLAHELRRLTAADDLLGPQRAAIILLRLALALRAGHDASLPHLDLRPSNVILVDETAASGPAPLKLLDLGLAPALGLAGAPGPRVVPAEARVSYTSPELRRGLAGDARADIYSLGVLAFELLTGRPPLLQHAGGWHPSAELAALQTGPQRTRGLPAVLERLVLRCLDADPAARPASAAEIVDELLALPGPTLLPRLPERAAAVPTLTLREAAATFDATIVVPARVVASQLASQSDALEDLALALRDRGLASPETTLALVGLLQNEDEVLRLEGEVEQVGSLLRLLEERTRQRNHRLRRALVAIEHERELLARAAESDPDTADAVLTSQLDRRATQLTAFLRHVGAHSEGQLESLRQQVRGRQLRLLRRAGHAAKLRERLLAELRTVGVRVVAEHADLLPLLRAARL